MFFLGEGGIYRGKHLCTKATLNLSVLFWVFETQLLSFFFLFWLLQMAIFCFYLPYYNFCYIVIVLLFEFFVNFYSLYVLLFDNKLSVAFAKTEFLVSGCHYPPDSKMQNGPTTISALYISSTSLLAFGILRKVSYYSLLQKGDLKFFSCNFLRHLVSTKSHIAITNSVGPGFASLGTSR